VLPTVHGCHYAFQKFPFFCVTLYFKLGTFHFVLLLNYKINWNFPVQYNNNNNNNILSTHRDHTNHKITSCNLGSYIHIYGLCINSPRCSSTEEMYVSLCMCFNIVGNFWICHIINIIILCPLQFQLYAVYINIVYLLDCVVLLVPYVCLFTVYFYPVILLHHSIVICSDMAIGLWSPHMRFCHFQAYLVAYYMGLISGWHFCNDEYFIAFVQLASCLYQTTHMWHLWSLSVLSETVPFPVPFQCSFHDTSSYPC
jgi:hypothetical protein